VAAVHDLVERAPVGPLDRRERAVGGKAERDQPGAEPVRREAQEAPGEVLIGNRRMGAADAQVGGGQGCWLPAEGVRRAASRIWSRCSFAIATSA
jgi:hypothetical protein